MKLIDVSTPKHPNTFATVDDEDFDSLSQYKWFAVLRGRTTKIFYVMRAAGHGQRSMHRFILKASGDSRVVDHINRDGLDNRKQNLRLCSQRENMRNSKQRNGSSRFKGVHWISARPNLWRAEIRSENGSEHLGYFTCEGCAAIAYDQAARNLHGEFARINTYEP